LIYQQSEIDQCFYKFMVLSHHEMTRLKSVLFLLFLFVVSISFGQVKPQSGAHAHNDYNNDRPLLDALEHGFTSIEVDVLVINGEIYVGHDLPINGYMLPTLDKLYLQLLDSIIKKNGGFLYPGFSIRCYLMIDIKTEAELTYKALHELLLRYQSIINIGESGQNSGIHIFLSGNRPVQTVLNDEKRLVSLDGRPQDLGKNYSANLMPVISQSYSTYSSWDGMGEMPINDQHKIRSLARKVHDEGKKLRLWGHPDNENTWTTLLTLGVDLINSDDLDGLSNYFSVKEEK